MNRITALIDASPAFTANVQPQSHPSASANNAASIISPQMRQAQVREESRPAGSALAMPVHHQMGSMRIKQRDRDKTDSSHCAVFSQELRDMSPTALVDKLMHFGEISFNDQLLPWDCWLQYHGAGIFLLAQLISQSEYIGHLKYALSAEVDLGEPAQHADARPAPVPGSRQQRLIFTQLFARLEESPSINPHEKEAITEQIKFLADAAREARPDVSKLFRYQLPKVLGSAVWPEKMDEQKLRDHLDKMGVYGLLSDMLVAVVNTTRSIRTQPMAGLSGDVQQILKQTLQLEFCKLAPEAISKGSMRLLAHLDEKACSLKIARYLLEQFHALTIQQLDAIRAAFGIARGRDPQVNQ